MNISSTLINELFVDTDMPKNIAQLNTIIERYLIENTFNNVDILLNPNEIMQLSIDHLINKILHRRSGGYCFEHNKLIHQFLTQCSFDCKSYLGRVVYGKDIDAPRTHRINIIHYQGQDYLVDVGFGAYTPNKAMPLSGDPVVCNNGITYKITKDEFSDYKVTMLKDGVDFVLYTFTRDKCTEADFELANYYTNTHPNSRFRQRLIISKFTPTGVIFLSNLAFTTIDNQHRTEKRLNNASSFIDIIHTEFELNLPTEEVENLYQITSSFKEF